MEYKFRGKTYEGEWVNGDYIKMRDRAFIVQKSVMDYNSDNKEQVCT